MKTVNIHNKEHPVYSGLLDEAHKQGLVSISTELIQAPLKENEYMAICRATVCIKEKTFEGIGDATPKNVNPMIAPHIVRMAETRAKGRALRDALNIGEALAEELGEDETTSKTQKPEKDTAVATCATHKVVMEQRYSEAKSKHYWSHRDPQKGICFGKEYMKRT